MALTCANGLGHGQKEWCCLQKIRRDLQLFLCLAHDSLLRIFVGFNMPTRGQPKPSLFVVHQQNFAQGRVEEDKIGDEMVWLLRVEMA